MPRTETTERDVSTLASVEDSHVLVHLGSVISGPVSTFPFEPNPDLGLIYINFEIFSGIVIFKNNKKENNG